MVKSHCFFLSLFLVCLSLGALLQLSGCAGYRFRNPQNPLAQFGIKSLSVPMFLNQSTLPRVSGPMTKEITLLLAEYPELKLYAKNNAEVDAVLVGVVRSPKKYTETVKSTQFNTSTQVAPEATSPRAEFFVPISSEIKLELNLILVKNPSSMELELLTSSLGQHIPPQSKIIFNKVLPLTATFSRETFDNSGSGDGVVVNMTQNIGNQYRTVQKMARDAATAFKELVLNAF